MRLRFISFILFFSTLNIAWGQVVITRPKTSTQKTQIAAKPAEKPKVRQQVTVSSPTGTQNGHGWVDLGLPSGTKWATTNVGANTPSGYGSYFAWGETSPKSSYEWSNLKYCLDSGGSEFHFSKYVTDSKYGSVDGKKELDLVDDAAYVNWGSGWRMPSKAQQDELREKCKWTWTSMGGHKGYKVVGPNEKSIFLPAAGHPWESYLSSSGYEGVCWSRSLNTSLGFVAYVLRFDPSNVYKEDFGRVWGLSVRPVLGSE